MTIDLDARRRELEMLRERLAGAAADLVGGDAPTEINTAAGDQHLADHASDLLDRELDASLGDNAEEIVREIDAALARIAAGTYGTCAACGGPIGEERLDAVPYATLCLDDRRAAERG